MEIGERILLIRKSARLNQAEFGQRIGVTRSAICNYESGNRPVRESAILSICREFGINEEWLRSGTGEMKKAAPSTSLDALAYDYNLRLIDYVLIEKLVTMDTTERDGIYRFMRDVFEGATAYGADPNALMFPVSDVKMAEAAYEKNFGIASGTDASLSSTSEGTA